ncbi:MAG: DHHA1 domain-containing protein [Ectobacillus sp.]
MTKKLYYEDAYLTTFTSPIIKHGKDLNGLYVVLEQTSFYPVGGGQPCDTGTLNDIEVINVEELDGEIRHYIAEELTEQIVTGAVNWERRFDHMQQHAGQHILSAAFMELFDMPTVAFHLGRDIVTIDIDTPELTLETARQAEQLANQVVFENRPITIRFVSEKEAGKLPLRKEPAVTENIRVVIIENFDYNGCGGTHPKHTGEVGPIKILGWERHKGIIRLEFACGWRTLRLLHEKQTVLKEMVRLLNSKESDLPIKAEQLLATQKETEKILRETNEKLLSFEAQQLIERARPEEFGKLIAASFENRNMHDLVKLSALLTKHEDTAVLFAAQNNGSLQCVCARGTAVDKNMNDVLKTILPLIEGNGGGSPISARGGGKALISAQEALQRLTMALLQ